MRAQRPASYGYQYCHGRRFSLLAAALLFGFASFDSICDASDRAYRFVQAALRSEVRSDPVRRDELIKTALQHDPNQADAHWAQGKVRIRGQWLSLSEAADDAKSRSSLEKYQERRDATENTPLGHEQLAQFCRANDLLAQERAHWSAVIDRDPNHLQARRRLGQIKVDGAWVDKREYDAQKKTEQATTVYLQKHSKRLTTLLTSLEKGSMAPEAVTKELVQFRNPMLLPGLEYLFSRASETGGQCTVETAASMSAPEASMSLARHALDFPKESVRTLATSYLKNRDEMSYVPGLLGALRTKATKEDQFTVTRNNQVIWRQKVFFESQNSKHIETYDRVFEISPQIPLQAVYNKQTVNAAIATGNSGLAAYNAEVDRNNGRIMQLLETTLDDDSPRVKRERTTPDGWWNWWNQRMESYPSDSKAVVSRYGYEYTVVTPPSARHECLAAGTPIWTEAGSVAVEKVKVGDLVLTKNPRSGELKFAAVLATTKRPPELLRRIKINDETIRATGGHPFWVTGKGWVKARSLEPGSMLHTAHGSTEIESIEDERTPTETFNLVVDECHSYFVGKTLLLSHDNSVCQAVATKVPGLRDDGLLVSKNDSREP
jgi:hypothetical protein